MRRVAGITVVLVLAFAAAASGLESRAIQMREDYGSEPLYDCFLSYYYYIPCPTYAWFWMFTGWEPGDKVGAWFEIGDVSTGQATQCDPTNCQAIEQLRVLDFAGYACYGHGYPGMWTQRFDIYCADALGCPVGPPLWTLPYVETCEGWNYIPVTPPLSVCSCAIVPGSPSSRPRILVIATHVGTADQYPAWGTDNISHPVSAGCAMHDIGCLPALYPRPYVSSYSAIHSGYYGNGSFQYCPPQYFKDEGDKTPDGAQYGYVEIAWRIYVGCSGPSATEPSTWGAIKSMYR